MEKIEEKKNNPSRCNNYHKYQIATVNTYHAKLGHINSIIRAYVVDSAHVNAIANWIFIISSHTADAKELLSCDTRHAKKTSHYEISVISGRKRQSQFARNLNNSQTHGRHHVSMICGYVVFFSLSLNYIWCRPDIYGFERTFEISGFVRMNDWNDRHITITAIVSFANCLCVCVFVCNRVDRINHPQIPTKLCINIWWCSSQQCNTPEFDEVINPSLNAMLHSTQWLVCAHVPGSPNTIGNRPQKGSPNHITQRTTRPMANNKGGRRRFFFRVCCLSNEWPLFKSQHRTEPKRHEILELICRNNWIIHRKCTAESTLVRCGFASLSLLGLCDQRMRMAESLYVLCVWVRLVPTNDFRTPCDIWMRRVPHRIKGAPCAFAADECDAYKLPGSTLKKGHIIQWRIEI